MKYRMNRKKTEKMDAKTPAVRHPIDTQRKRKECTKGSLCREMSESTTKTDCTSIESEDLKPMSSTAGAQDGNESEESNGSRLIDWESAELILQTLIAEEQSPSLSSEEDQKINSYIAIRNDSQCLNDVDGNYMHNNSFDEGCPPSQIESAVHHHHKKRKSEAPNSTKTPMTPNVGDDQKFNVGKITFHQRSPSSTESPTLPLVRSHRKETSLQGNQALDEGFPALHPADRFWTIVRSLLCDHYNKSEDWTSALSFAVEDFVYLLRISRFMPTREPIDKHGSGTLRIHRYVWDEFEKNVALPEASDGVLLEHKYWLKKELQVLLSSHYREEKENSERDSQANTAAIEALSNQLEGLQRISTGRRRKQRQKQQHSDDGGGGGGGDDDDKGGGGDDDNGDWENDDVRSDFGGDGNGDNVEGGGTGWGDPSFSDGFGGGIDDGAAGGGGGGGGGWRCGEAHDGHIDQNLEVRSVRAAEAHPSSKNLFQNDVSPKYIVNVEGKATELTSMLSPTPQGDATVGTSHSAATSNHFAKEKRLSDEDTVGGSDCCTSDSDDDGDDDDDDHTGYKNQNDSAHVSFAALADGDDDGDDTGYKNQNDTAHVSFAALTLEEQAMPNADSADINNVDDEDNYCCWRRELDKSDLEVDKRVGRFDDDASSVETTTITTKTCTTDTLSEKESSAVVVNPREEEDSLFSSSWNATSIPPMPISRRDFAAVAIHEEGKIVVLGGKDSNLDDLSSVEAFSQKTLQRSKPHALPSWQHLTDMTTRRSSFGAAIVVTRLPSSTTTSLLESLDGSSPPPHHQLRHLVIAAGSHDGRATNSAQLWNLSTKEWTDLPHLNLKRNGCAVTTLYSSGLMGGNDNHHDENCGGHVYVVGGRRSGGVDHDCGGVYHDSVEWLDVSALLADGSTTAAGWQYLQSSMKLARCDCAVAIVDNDIKGDALQQPHHLVVMGGGTKEGTTETVESFDFRTGQWHDLPSMTTPRFGGAAVAVGCRVFVVGGLDENWNSLATAEYYDFRTNCWTGLSPMSVPREGCSMVVVTNNRNGDNKNVSSDGACHHLVVLGGYDDQRNKVHSLVEVLEVGEGSVGTNLMMS